MNFSLQGAEQFIELDGDGAVNNDFTIEVPSTSPITDMQLSIGTKPSVMQTHYGFVWDSDAAWSNPDATKNGTVVERDVLTGSTAGTLWDFNNGLQGLDSIKFNIRKSLDKHLWRQWNFRRFDKNPS